LATGLKQAEKEAESMGDEFISREHLFLALMEVDPDTKEIAQKLNFTKEKVKEVLMSLRGSQKVTDKDPEGKYNVLIDGGACRVGVESTVLSLINDIPVLLRPGGVSIDEIRSIIGPVQIRGNNNLPNPQSPGMMTSHYSTDTPLVVYPEIPKKLEKDPHTGFILFGPPEKDFTGPVEVLSKHHILREAAVNLYAAMRRLDSMDLRLIATHRFPDCGLGTAINDRLGKASGKK
ncbi:MAG: hypothetical protein L3J12_05285, partial [Spirochaetales bacterium]|nr:hypothetical protein [Spirochaetales bacterium]